MSFTRFIDSFSIKAGVLATLALGGCIATTLPYMRAETAQRIAAPAWMIKRTVPAGEFSLRAYERIHNRGGVANLYIEGNGSGMLGDPTPENPIALHLASKDKADNLIYLARPCQYVGTDGCDKIKNDKYSSTVINGYIAALDEISARYGISGFHLIGYDGGAVIASRLASERSDILSLRTVAGLLGEAPESAKNLVKMPQYHFIGGQDSVVPPAHLHSYLQAMPPSSCVQTMLVQEADHKDGWVNKWPEFLSLPVNCFQDDNPVLEPIRPAPPVMALRPNDYKTPISREKPAKP